MRQLPMYFPVHWEQARSWGTEGDLPDAAASGQSARVPHPGTCPGQTRVLWRLGQLRVKDALTCAVTWRGSVRVLQRPPAADSWSRGNWRWDWKSSVSWTRRKYFLSWEWLHPWSGYIEKVLLILQRDATPISKHSILTFQKFDFQNIFKGLSKMDCAPF